MATKSPRDRIFFLTIHQSAKCFNDFKETLQNGKYQVWAWILHDKDVEQDGTMTPAHYHAIFEIPNARTFNSICKEFPGAHVEIPSYKKEAYRYLIHRTEKSKDKYQYAFDEIVSNSKELVKEIITREEYETYVETRIFNYMAEGVVTIYQFVKRFGQTQYMKYGKSYFEIKRDLLEHDPKFLENLEKTIMLETVDF